MRRFLILPFFATPAVPLGAQALNVAANPRGVCAQKFVSQQRSMCTADALFSVSTASKQANADVTVEVSRLRTQEQAWKLLASIVLSHFPVLEKSDRQTGYLRTAWQIQSFGSNNEVVIRSRIIVEHTGDQPLRYTVRIVSERNETAVVSVKGGEVFIPWDRLLNIYKNVIPEMRAKLR